MGFHAVNEQSYRLFYEAFLTFLLGFRFKGLLRPEERPQAEDRALESLGWLRSEHHENPGLEGEMLYAASDAWRVLQERAWHEVDCWIPDDGSEWVEARDLPLGWLQSLLRQEGPGERTLPEIDG